MDRLVYLTAMALLGIGLTVGQNTRPSSDPSNSSNPSAQTQRPEAGNDTANQSSANSVHRRPQKGARSQSEVPSPTIRDQQNSTTSTTGVTGREAEPAPSTMGTTGGTPGTADQNVRGNGNAVTPQNGTPTEQQPNATTNPGPTPRHAELMQTPASRAVATHTPDPGTCMNPAAIESGQSSGPPASCE